MSGVDHAWLRMERPSNLMVINGVFILDGHLSHERLLDIARNRLLSFPRFRQRIASDADDTWEDDPNLDLHWHVHRRALPKPAGKVELQDLVSDLMSVPLDRERPLWRFYLVEDYLGGSALITRTHHAYADGIALMRVLLAICDPVPGTAAAVAEPNAPTASGGLESLLGPLLAWPRRAARLGEATLSEALSLLRNPQRGVDYARSGLQLSGEALKLALLPADTQTRFKGAPGISKRVAWAEPLQLDEIKAIGKVLGCSVNDVLLSAITGALRWYLLEQGDSVENVEIRAVVPVNLRQSVDDTQLGNQFGLVFLALPLGIGNPIERAFELRSRMQALRNSTEAAFMLGLQAVTGYAPAVVQDELIQLLSAKASAVMTTVRGPARPLFMGGAQISEAIFWVPQSGEICMGISIFSYNERVHFGLAVDERRIGDPQRLITRFGYEFEQLLLSTLLGGH
jgi:WS/DGAT/MGAT family acyltransferase